MADDSYVVKDITGVPLDCSDVTDIKQEPVGVRVCVGSNFCLLCSHAHIHICRCDLFFMQCVESE